MIREDAGFDEESNHIIKIKFWLRFDKVFNKKPVFSKFLISKLKLNFLT
jgi:hypothetical protein